MANTDAAFGLRYVKNLNGKEGGVLTRCYIPASLAALRIGDPVIKTGTTNTAEFQGEPAGYLMAITKATAGAGNQITGVIESFEPVNELSGNGNPANTARIALVRTDADAVYSVQCDDASGTPAVTDIGSNADLVFGSVPTDGYGGSSVELDTDTIGTGATKQVKIIGIDPAPNNVPGAYAKYLVTINVPTEVPHVAGI